MLPKNQRLTRKRIEYLFKKGKRQNTPSFAMTFIWNDQTFARFSAVVSTKVHPLAVNRNRLRRQCYEIIRTHLTQIPSNIDVIITTRSSSARLPFEELSQKLIEALKTLKS